MFHVVFCILLLLAIADRLHRLGKRELFFLLSFSCNYVVVLSGGFLLRLVLGIGYVILLWNSLGLPYNYFKICTDTQKTKIVELPSEK